MGLLDTIRQASAFLAAQGRVAGLHGATTAATRLVHETLDLYRTNGASGHAARLAREPGI